jgi:hypothetical protein
MGSRGGRVIEKGKWERLGKKEEGSLEGKNKRRIERKKER